MFITNDLDIFPSFSIPAVLYNLIVNDELQEKLCNGLNLAEKALRSCVILKTVA